MWMWGGERWRWRRELFLRLLAIWRTIDMMSDAKGSRSRKTTRERQLPAGKRPFTIEQAMPLLREAVTPYPKAALFELAAEGYNSIFEVLVACIISIRTRDETTLPIARSLFAKARTPADVAGIVG
jgi:endonuclease III